MAIQNAFTLTANEIYDTLANMIISQEVLADNIGKNQTLVDLGRVEGSLKGDTKLYYSTDVLYSSAWGNDAEAANLLALDRAEDPEVQAIKLDVFRQIRLTVDNYLSKRAFADEGTFASFNGVMLVWLRDTKKVYDGTNYNVFIGTTETAVGKQTRTVDIAGAVGSATGIEAAQLEATSIAQDLADLLVEMGDYSRDFNDYGNLRSYADESIKVVWNSKFVNKIKKVDLPTIFHKEGLIDKFEEHVLPAKYFGTVNKNATVGNGTTVRAVTEMMIGSNHYFAGDLIKTTDTAPKNMSYTESDDVICKVLVKLPPYMSAFEVGTTFFNPRSLTESHYLTFGHNTLDYLKNYPFITVKKKAQ